VDCDVPNPHCKPHIYLTAELEATGTGLGGDILMTRCHFTDVYAIINGVTGNIEYNTLHSWRYVSRSVLQNITWELEHFADIYAVEGREDTGMWIGTHVEIDFTCNAATSVNGMSGIGGGIAIENLYAPGELNPCRIIRWDSLSDGQVLNLRGEFMVEAVPQGSVAPYVTPSLLTQQMTFQINTYPLLQSLYNGIFPIFRRMYIAQDYDRILREVLPNMTSDNFTRHEATREIENAASAAGLFSGLGGELGGLFGKRGREVGTALGALGDMGQRVLSRSGASAGQFGGLAAGQFGGDAAGQFGAFTPNY